MIGQGARGPCWGQPLCNGTLVASIPKSMGYRYYDAFVKKARQENKLARSYYKLADLNRQYRLLPQRQPWRVLDLGAAPGSWSQWFCEQIQHPESVVVAVDLKPLKFKHSQLIFFQSDIREISWDQEPWNQWVPFDLIVCDMMAPTSGIRDVDQARSFELAQWAWLTAQKTLKNGGHWLIKVFDQPSLSPWLKQIKPFFSQIRRVRPEAVRSSSSEVYLVGLQWKGTQETLKP